MRILLVSGSYPPMKCGVGDYTKMLAIHLSRIPGNTISVLTSEAATDKCNSEVEAIAVSSVSGWQLTNSMQLYRQIRALAPDVVHVQYPTQGYSSNWLPSLMPLLAWIQGTLVVQTWHEGCSIRKVIDLFLQGLVPGGLIVVRPGYLSKIPKVLRWAVWNKEFRHIPNASSIPSVQLNSIRREEIRSKYLCGQVRLIVFFGFLLPHKRAALLFDIADPARDHIVFVGESIDPAVTSEIEGRQNESRWTGRSTLVGFMESQEIAELLASADAVVLPFRDGGGEWNSSIHAAVAQGTFVLSTSRTETGYDPTRNVYLAEVENVDEMKVALTSYAGTRRNTAMDPDEWISIADRHQAFYESLSAA